MKFWSVKKLNNAFLACKPGSSFFKKALELVPLANPEIKFNLGPMLMNRVWESETHHELVRLNQNCFYLLPPSQTYRFFYGPAPAVPADTYAFHWCHSNHRKLVSGLTRNHFSSTIKNPTLFQKLVKPVIDKMS